MNTEKQSVKNMDSEYFTSIPHTQWSLNDFRKSISARNPPSTNTVLSRFKRGLGQIASNTNSTEEEKIEAERLLEKVNTENKENDPPHGTNSITTQNGSHIFIQNSSGVSVTQQAQQPQQLQTQPQQLQTQPQHLQTQSQHLQTQPQYLQTQPQQQQMDRFNNMDDEQKLHFIAHKVFREAALTRSEKSFLNDYVPQQSIKGSLLRTAVEKLRKPKMNDTEKATVELCLSSIVNNINPVIQKELDNNMVGSNLALYTMNEKTEELFDKIAAQADDIDEMLKTIQQEKTTLLESRKRQSEEYTMLSIVETVAENFGLWLPSKKLSELTFYRRFSGLLDPLFMNSNILLADGEAGCKSTKEPIQRNKDLFNVNDPSHTYPRKIDLLLRLDDTTEVDMCSNEWKKSSVSEAVKLKQQTKNLQVNACIISNLRKQFGTRLKSTLALDLVGNTGYMYCIEATDEVYVADMVGIILIPEDPETFPLFKDTLNLLFGMKYFFMDISKILKQELRLQSVKRQLENIAHDIGINSSPPDMPLIFFPQPKKRKTNDDEQE